MLRNPKVSSKTSPHLKYMVITISGEISQELWDVYVGMDEDMDQDRSLLSRFSCVLHGDISKQNIDDVIDIYEELKPILEKSGEFMAFADELRWFSAVYQHGDVEFKR